MGTQSSPATIFTGVGVISVSPDGEDSVAPKQCMSPGERVFAGLVMRSSNPPPNRELSCMNTSRGQSRANSQRVAPSRPTRAIDLTPLPCPKWKLLPAFGNGSSFPSYPYLPPSNLSNGIFTPRKSCSILTVPSTVINQRAETFPPGCCTNEALPLLLAVRQSILKGTMPPLVSPSAALPTIFHPGRNPSGLIVMPAD